MKGIYHFLVQLDISSRLEIIISLLLIIITGWMLYKAYRAVRESIVSCRNLTDQRKKNSVYRLATKRYRYFSGLCTSYVNMPKDSNLSKVYNKYKYQIAAVACANLSKIAIHQSFDIDSDGTRHMSDFFFLVCTGIKTEKYTDGNSYVHVLFEDPFGKVISQALYDVPYEEAERMIGHFCITEMLYYPDKESAKVWAIHVTNLTLNGYVNQNNKPYGFLRQRLTSFWKITKNYNNTAPGEFIHKISKEDQDERVKEILTLNPTWEVAK